MKKNKSFSVIKTVEGATELAGESGGLGSVLAPQVCCVALLRYLPSLGF